MLYLLYFDQTPCTEPRSVCELLQHDRNVRKYAMEYRRTKTHGKHFNSLRYVITKKKKRKFREALYI